MGGEESEDDHTLRMINSDIYFSLRPCIKDSQTAAAAVFAAIGRARAAKAAGATCSNHVHADVCPCAAGKLLYTVSNWGQAALVEPLRQRRLAHTSTQCLAAAQKQYTLQQQRVPCRKLQCAGTRCRQGLPQQRKAQRMVQAKRTGTTSASKVGHHIAQHVVSACGTYCCRPMQNASYKFILLFAVQPKWCC